MPSDDINPLDVTVAYVSVINKSKTIKCLGYLWPGDILLMGRPKEELYFGVIDHDIHCGVQSSEMISCAIFVWHKLCQHRQRSIIINIVQHLTITH